MEIKGIFCNAFFGKNFVKVTTVLLNETLRVDLTKSVFGGSKFFIFPHWGGSTNLKFFTLWDPFLWGRGVVVLLQTKCLLSRLAHVCLRVFGQMYHILKNTYCLHFGCKAITLLPFQNLKHFKLREIGREKNTRLHFPLEKMHFLITKIKCCDIQTGRCFTNHEHWRHCR